MPTEQRILLVDDDHEFADLLCRHRRKRGYQVTSLYHPRQALEAVEKSKFEVAILDRSLPEIDAFV